MAPNKGTKRASGAHEDPKAKRIAAFLKQQGFSKAQQEAVKEILNHPLAGIPEECRDMLLAMLPWSVCIAEEERKDFQSKVVGMVEHVIKTIQATLRKKIDAESATLGQQDGQYAGFLTGLQDAKASWKLAEAAVGERTTELAEVSVALAAQQQAFSEVEATEKRETADHVKAVKQKQKLEMVLEGNFKRLKEDEWERGEEEALFRPVKNLMSSLDIDQSFIISLPVSLLKKNRAGFDQVVVDTFEETLRSKIGDAAREVEALSGAAATHIAATAEAKKELDAVEARHRAADESCNVAQEASARAAGVKKEAKNALAAFEPAYTEATAARTELTTELETFTDYNVCLFHMMAYRATKKPDPVDLTQTSPVKAARPENEAAVGQVAVAEGD